MKKKIIARFFIKNESIETFKNLAAELIAATRQEEGCLSYSLFQDIENRSEFAFIEEYADENAMKLHSQSTYLRSFIKNIKDLQTKDLIIEVI